MPVGTGGASAPPTLTVAVLTHNEAHRIEACLKSAAFADQLLAHSRGDYVFFLDADEVMTPAFAQELQAIVRSGEQAVWTIRWRMVAYGHELKYFRSQSQIERLFVRALVKEYTGVVHEQAQLHALPGGA